MESTSGLKIIIMTNEEIKRDCSINYKQIELAQERLRELRAICKHEHTTERPYAWRVGAHEIANICDYCGENCGNVTIETKKEETLLRKDGVFSRQLNVDADGNLNEFMPAAPIGMRCEKPNCSNAGGKDYKRNKNETIAGWEGEPIFLCDEHSEGHELD